MSLCERCKHGEYHGFNRNPEVACTVSFRCPVKGDHDMTRTLCTDYRRGVPKKVYDDMDGC